MIIDKSKEEVLVFPSAILKDIGYFEGVCLKFEDYLNTILPKSHFMQRSYVEKNLKYKQIIPYAILYHNNEILSYRRGTISLEHRLANKWSMGIGGHITTCDVKSTDNVYDSCLKREINEEVYLDTKYKTKIVAILNDDSNEVGRVHFGIIFLLELELPIVRKKEKSIIDCQFVSLKYLKKTIKKYERWSQICIQNIDKLLKI